MKCSECKCHLDPDEDWNCHEVADSDCVNDLKEKEEENKK